MKRLVRVDFGSDKNFFLAVTPVPSAFVDMTVSPVVDDVPGRKFPRRKSVRRSR
jgi:hypothetical protein